MNPRTLRLASLVITLMVVAGGAGPALAQTPAGAPPAPKTVQEADQQLADLQTEIDAAYFEIGALDAGIRIGNARLAELREGSRVALEGTRGVVYMDRPAFRNSLRRHVFQWTLEEFRRTGDYTLLSDIGDAAAVARQVAELEEPLLRESENYRKWLELDVADMDKRLNAAKDRLWRLIDRAIELAKQGDRLEAAQAAREGRPPASRSQAGASGSAGALSNGKAFFGEKLEELRKAGNWSADHHMQVGTFIGVARTIEELYAAARLMFKYAGCYDTKNLRRAAVLANARTGMYKSAGERIAALDEIAVDFNKCTGTAATDFHQARARLSNPGK